MVVTLDLSDGVGVCAVVTPERTTRAEVELIAYRGDYHLEFGVATPDLKVVMLWAARLEPGNEALAVWRISPAEEGWPTAPLVFTRRR